MLENSNTVEQFHIRRRAQLSKLMQCAMRALFAELYPWADDDDIRYLIEDGSDGTIPAVLAIIRDRPEVVLLYTCDRNWGDLMDRFEDPDFDVAVLPSGWWRGRITEIFLSRAHSELLVPVLLDHLGGLTALGLAGD